MTNSQHVARPRRPVWPWIAAAEVLAFVWFARVVTQWGDRNWVFLSISAVVLGLLALGLWLLAMLAPPLFRLIVSLAKSLGPAVVADPEVRRLSARYPRMTRWLGRRTSQATWRGLYLTATVLLCGYFFVGFLTIARGVAGSASITHYDIQVSALLRAFRSAELSRVLWVFTILGDPRVAWAITPVGCALLVVWGRRREALLLSAAVGGAALLGAFAKLLLSRTRPDTIFALIKSPASFSFPSGHALYALCFWGVIALLGMRSRLRLSYKVAAVFSAMSVIVLTAVSRVYLGVHWASDILASWMLGLTWLSACVGVYLMWMRYAPAPAEPTAWSRRTRVTVTTAALLAVALVVVWGAESDPILTRLVAPVPAREWAVSTNTSGFPVPTSAQIAALPAFSEKLDGTNQEPIGLVFMGTEQQLTRAFRRSGWSVADPPSPLTVLHTVASAMSNTPYLTAPVTPTFLDGNVQDIAFEKPEGPATVRRRHHCRWWRTNLTFRGAEIWVATASFDSRLEIGSAIPLPTHHIDSDIDAEQRYIVDDLTRAGLKSVGTIRVSPPTAGTDAQGDQWFTQGMATIVAP